MASIFMIPLWEIPNQGRNSIKYINLSLSALLCKVSSYSQGNTSLCTDRTFLDSNCITLLRDTCYSVVMQLLAVTMSLANSDLSLKYTYMRH